MKKVLGFVLVLALSVTTLGCSTQPTTSNQPPASKDYSGTYTGYSWKEEAKGTKLDEAKEKIETVLTLDKNGVITDAKLLFYVKDKEGKWYTRTDSSAEVSVDFNVKPTPAIPQNDKQEYAAGNSMFKVKTADFMSFYTVAVSQDSTIALGIVEPTTRYLYEIQLDKNADLSMKLKDMTVGNGLIVPTVRTSAGAMIKPKDWSEYKDKNLLNFSGFAHVLTDRGIFKGITEESTIKELLQAAGVAFDGDIAKPLEVKYGRTSTGGWEGNYKSIESFLVGKNTLELKSLIDWENPRYKAGINKDNFFGVDTTAGATKTVQNSIDGIAGATVRMSREATSYQRALVEAGILTEEEVIKGRF